MDTTRDKVQGTIDDLAGKAHRATDTVAGRVHQATDKAAEAATHAKESVQQMASSAAESMVHAKDAVSHLATDTVQHTGEYLKAGGEEVTGLIRRYPIAAVLVGIGIGFVLAKVTRV
jgi:hypothetical protein